MKRIAIALVIALGLLALSTNHPLTTLTSTFGRTLVRDAAHAFFRSLK